MRLQPTKQPSVPYCLISTVLCADFFYPTSRKNFFSRFYVAAKNCGFFLVEKNFFKFFSPFLVLLENHGNKEDSIKLEFNT